MDIKKPKHIINHQSQEFSCEANSVECLTIKVHLAKESPNPARAPYRDATEWQKQVSRRKPIQLNMNAIVKAARNIMSVPNKWSFELGLFWLLSWLVSIDKNVKGCSIRVVIDTCGGFKGCVAWKGGGSSPFLDFSISTSSYVGSFECTIFSSMSTAVVDWFVPITSYGGTLIVW